MQIVPEALRRPPRRRGSTLVELVVAATVLTLGAVAAAVQSARAHELRIASEQTLVATAHLRSVLAQIREQEPAALLVADHEFAPGVIAAQATAVLRGQRTLVEYPGFAVGDAAPDLLPVVVRTEWTTPKGGTRAIEMATAVKR